MTDIDHAKPDYSDEEARMMASQMISCKAESMVWSHGPVDAKSWTIANIQVALRAAYLQGKRDAQFVELTPDNAA